MTRGTNTICRSDDTLGMNRSPLAPLLGVAGLAFLAGLLYRVQVFLPTMTTHEGLVALNTLTFGLVLVRGVGLTLAAVALGYASPAQFDLETSLGRTALLVFAAAFVGYALGGVVGTALAPTGGFAGGRPAQLLDGGVSSLVGGVSLTVAVVAGAAVARLRGQGD